MEILTEIAKHLELGEDEEVTRLTAQAIKDHLPAEQILNNGLLTGMNIVGDQFKKHEIFLPDVLMAAKAMQAAMELLKPLLIRDGIPSRGLVVIGTVQGDLHDIGKNLVSIMLRGAGYDIVDLGIDVSPQRFIAAAQEHHASIIAMSALLTTTMPKMKEVVQLLHQKNLHTTIKTLVGGAPLSQKYATEIGANAYAHDGSHAVQCVAQLLN